MFENKVSQEKLLEIQQSILCYLFCLIIKKETKAEKKKKT
jgi:hypothetical protein